MCLPAKLEKAANQLRLSLKRNGIILQEHMTCQKGCLHQANKAVSKYAFILEPFKLPRKLVTFLLKMPLAFYAKGQILIVQCGTRLTSCFKKPCNSYRGMLFTDTKGLQSLQIFTQTCRACKAQHFPSYWYKPLLPLVPLFRNWLQSVIYCC